MQRLCDGAGDGGAIHPCRHLQDCASHRCLRCCRCFSRACTCCCLCTQVAWQGGARRGSARAPPKHQPHEAWHACCLLRRCRRRRAEPLHRLEGPLDVHPVWRRVRRSGDDRKGRRQLRPAGHRHALRLVLWWLQGAAGLGLAGQNPLPPKQRIIQCRGPPLPRTLQMAPACGTSTARSPGRA